MNSNILQAEEGLKEVRMQGAGRQEDLDARLETLRTETSSFGLH